MSENVASPQGGGEGAGASAEAGGNGATGQEQTGAGEGSGNEGESGEDGEGGGDAGGDDDWSDPRTAKKRFTSLSAIAREAQASAQKAIDEANRLRGRLEQATMEKGGKAEPTPKVDPNPKPDANDKAKYPHGLEDPNYIIDRAKYEIRKEDGERAAIEAATNSAKADFETRKTNYFAAIDKAKANPDTPKAADQIRKMPTQIADMVAASDQGALIAEHLANNKAEYDALLSANIRVEIVDGEEHYHWKTPSSALAFAKKVGVYEATLPGVFAAKKATKGKPPEGVGGGGGAGADATPKYRNSEEYRELRRAGKL